MWLVHSLTLQWCRPSKPAVLLPIHIPPFCCCLCCVVHMLVVNEKECWEAFWRHRWQQLVNHCCSCYHKFKFLSVRLCTGHCCSGVSRSYTPEYHSTNYSGLLYHYPRTVLFWDLLALLIIAVLILIALAAKLAILSVASQLAAA